MANTHSEALLVSSSWDTDLTSQPTRTLIKGFCENKLECGEVSKLYCTVLDVEVSEDQKKDAESVGVTLIPATRSKWADPDEDPPVVNWLFNHNTYYQQLKDLQNIKHVVSFSPNTKNAAAAIHESLFPQAQLHQFSVPTPPGVLFAFDAWSRDACGLTGYHRAIIQDFIVRKAESGEYLKAYSTVVDVELSADQIEDAEKCGVTLIKAHRKKGVDEKPKLEWLMYHESLFPDLQKLKNIKYVVGYAPKTGWAAVDIRKKLFFDAKLVLINHAHQETTCLLVKGEFSILEQEMLQMASHADLLFSIGPHTFYHFQRAYRAVVQGRKLYDIPHKEILPKPRQQYFDNERPETDIEIDGHSILTYGQLNTEEALERCDSIAVSIGSAANKHKEFGQKPLEWKIQGVSEQAYKATKNFLVGKLQSSHALPKPYKHNSTDSLLQSLQQSDLCLPPSCYTDYSFEGLEAMAAGLPTTVQDDSHIAAMIEKHFEKHKDYCVVRNNEEKLTAKIVTNLKTKNNIAVKQAKLLQEALATSEAVTESLARFASSLTDEDAETKNSGKTGKSKMIMTIQEKEKAQMTESAMQPGLLVDSTKETTETVGLQPDTTVREDRETTENTAVQAEATVREDRETTESRAVQPEATEREDRETTEITAVQPEATVRDDRSETTENVTKQYKLRPLSGKIGRLQKAERNTAVQAEATVREDRETKESRAVQPQATVREDRETTENTAIQPEASLREDKETTESRVLPPEIPAMRPGVSVRDNIETATATTVQPGRSDSVDVETTETRAVQSVMPNLEGIENAEITAVQSGISVSEGMENAEFTTVQTRALTKGFKTTTATAVQYAISNTEDTRTAGTIKMHPGMSNTKDLDITARSGTTVQSGISVVEGVDTTKHTTVQDEVTEVQEETDNSDRIRQGLITGDENNDRNSLRLAIARQKDYRKTKEKNNDIKRTHPEMSKKECRMGRKMKSSGFDSTDIVVYIGLNEESCEQQMRGLNKLVQTNSVRKKKEKLKAMWKKCKAELAKNASEVIANEESKRTVNYNCTKHLGEVRVESIMKSSLTIHLDLPTVYNLYRLEHTCLSGSFPDSFEPLLITDKMRAEADKFRLQLKLKATYDQARFNVMERFFINSSTDFVVNIGLITESYEQQMRDLNNLFQTNSVRKKKKKLTDRWEKCQAELVKNASEVIVNEGGQQIVRYYCMKNLGKVKVESITKGSLAIHLDLPTVYNLYRLEHTCLSGSFPDSFEPLLITDKMREEADKVGLQLKLKATYDQARFDELELFFINRDGGGLKPVKVYDDVIEGKDAEEIHIDGEDTDKTVTEGVADRTPIEHRQSLEDIQSKLEMERATLESQLKEAKNEKSTLEERCKELTKKLESTEQSLVSQRIGNSVERDKLQSELKENQKLVKEFQDEVLELEYKLEQSDLKKAGEKGDWSLTLVNGQHHNQGQKFRSPRGLAFHCEKLVVCDSGNNIVQILNKDFTCDKVLGSFDGQFPKPFRPLSVAISGLNHYFILDDENKQIVVCDENGKIIKIITLPENTDAVWDIALMEDFVLVTLSLTSPDTYVRPVDRGDRLVKYTQNGEYVTEVDNQGSDHTQFNDPVSVAVNSNNVIMVYDSGSGCIKCFDSNLKFLYQFGQHQISRRIVGYIAVDEDDNVYVCDYIIDRILKYRCDGKWICDLFKDDVSYPEYIAVMGDKIGVVESDNDQIKVFSK